MEETVKKWISSKLLEDRTFMARVAEEAEMYDDMVLYIKDVLATKKDGDFTVEERNLINVSFKNFIN